jgi:LPXTG-site transpeptidase (sortase) family protein
MSLRINNLVRKIPHILFGLVVIFLVGCLIKVAVWEHLYYQEKEGSPRQSLEEVGVGTPETEEVDETEITQQEIYIHTVAPDRPRYIYSSILNRTMGVDVPARVFGVGLTPAGAMKTRASIFDVAWYQNSGKPGQGGVILMNGHNGGPNKDGVFKDLHLIKNGAIITIERGDGEIFNYEVRDVKILPLAEANAYMATMMKSPIQGKESLSLISCTGEWSQQQRTYLSRIMVRAVLVDNWAE